MGIGHKIEHNIQLQEFVERALSVVFEMAQEDEILVETFCDDMGITEEEMYWMFEQLGYEREEE
jgi:hypothetical protein